MHLHGVGDIFDAVVSTPINSAFTDSLMPVVSTPANDYFSNYIAPAGQMFPIETVVSTAQRLPAAPLVPLPAASASDWWTRNVTPILTTAITTAGSVLRAGASTPYAGYGGTALPPGVSPLAYQAMTPAQQAALMYGQPPASSLSAQLKPMMPMLLLSGVGLAAIMIFTGKKKRG